MVFIPTDLPEPVVPAINRCGMRSKFAKILLPDISFPSANVRLSFSISKPSSSIKSPNKTLSLLVFGISIPKLVFPGWVEILADKDDIALAISSDKPITLLDFIPALGTNSNKVTIGPLLKPIILPSTPYSDNVFSNFDAASVFTLSSSLLLLFFRYDLERRFFDGRLKLKLSNSSWFLILGLFIFFLLKLT